MTNMVYVVYGGTSTEPIAVFKDRDLACDLCDLFAPADYWVADLPILNSVEEYKND